MPISKINVCEHLMVRNCELRHIDQVSPASWFIGYLYTGIYAYWLLFTTKKTLFLKPLSFAHLWRFLHYKIIHLYKILRMFFLWWDNKCGGREGETLKFNDISFCSPRKRIPGLFILILLPNKQIWQLVICEIINNTVLYCVQTNFDIVNLRTILGSSYKVTF